MFTLSPHLWAPQIRGFNETVALISKGKSVCLQGPTGSGKTTIAYELLRWAHYHGMDGSFYVNRKLLIGQTHSRFITGGLNCAIRAADYEDHYDIDAPQQICSADTERSRVLDKKIWNFHPSKLIIIDEAHIQRTETMRAIINHYRQAGAMVVGLTATPIGLSSWYDELVVSGRLAEYRDCKALVPAIVRSIQQPDMSKVKRNATGEFVVDGEKRKVYTQSIVGDVIGSWKKFNPDARPTMLFAPGMPESVWFTEQFQKLGVNWCHVDATDAIVDGKRSKLTRALWEEIQARYKQGDIKGLSCRFKLREGVDLPSTYHAIFATPIGSLASYIQTAGRVLRYSPETPDSVLITDHGGNYLRHGSPNHDRDWKLFWRLPEGAVSEWHLNQIRDKKAPEPICCPACHGERTGGIKCPHCGHTHDKSKRHVVMEDGTLVEKDGRMVPLRRVQRRSDTEQLWASMYFGFKRKGVKKTFAQMYGFFTHEYGYAPPRDLAYMPRREEHWYERVPNLDVTHLIDRKAG